MKTLTIILICLLILSPMAGFTFSAAHACAHSGHTCAHGGGGYLLITSHSHNYFNKFDEIRKTNYNGYAVYNNDTLRGTLYIKGETVTITNAAGTGTKYKLIDTNLHTLYLTDKDNQRLFLTKFDAKENTFYRLVYTGKLSLYDYSYTFDYSHRGIKLDDMKVAYNNKIEDMNTFWTTFPKKRLVYYINKVYGQQLNPKEYSKAEVLDYLKKLG